MKKKTSPLSKQRNWNEQKRLEKKKYKINWKKCKRMDEREEAVEDTSIDKMTANKKMCKMERNEAKEWHKHDVHFEV